MDDVTDESIALVVTSPPYWQIKDYGTEEQIGYHDSYEDYVNDLNLVWKECYRTLKPGCKLCINIGDQFLRASEYGRYKIVSIKSEIIRFCETVGFDYMGCIIWHKVSSSKTSGGNNISVAGSYPFPRNGILNLNYEWILVFKKLGETKPSPESKELSKMTNDEWKLYFNGHWSFPGERQKEHSAAFPEELPSRLIKMYSFHGERILDPFLGSGTTMKVADRLGRECVGYELNPAYVSVIKNRVNYLFHKEKYELLKREPLNYAAIAGRKSLLPYLFIDPVKIQRIPTKKEPPPKEAAPESAPKRIV
jgi:DNA modification methylase